MSCFSYPICLLFGLVYLQVIGKTPTTSAAVVTPFLIMAALSSTVANHVAFKFGHVRPLFLFALCVLPVGMVRRPFDHDRGLTRV